MKEYFESQIIKRNDVEDPNLVYMIEDICYFKGIPSIALEMKAVKLSKVETDMLGFDFVRSSPGLSFTIPVFKIKQNLN